MSRSQRTARQPHRLPRLRSAAAILFLAAVAFPLAAVPPNVAVLERRVGTAEKDLAKGDYPSAGELARKVLATGTAPEALRARALTVLGKVLFFNSRAPLGSGEEKEGEAASREQGLALAERALRDAASSAGPAAPEARLFLSELLWTVERRAESRAVLDDYFAALQGDSADPRANRLRACLEAFRPAVSPPEGEAAPESPAEPLELGDDLEPPRRLTTPSPTYTEAARKARIGGTVIVQVVVDRQGEVVCPRALKALPLGLTESALDTLSTWRFEPATFRGEPVAVYYNLTVTYGIDRPR